MARNVRYHEVEWMWPEGLELLDKVLHQTSDENASLHVFRCRC